MGNVKLLTCPFSQKNAVTFPPVCHFPCNQLRVSVYYLTLKPLQGLCGFTLSWGQPSGFEQDHGQWNPNGHLAPRSCSRATVSPQASPSTSLSLSFLIGE